MCQRRRRRRRCGGSWSISGPEYSVLGQSDSGRSLVMPTLARSIMLALIAALSTASAGQISQAPWSPATPPLGIVLMHGKNGPPRYLAGIKTILEDHGYLVATPEMCWSDKRMYDRDYADGLPE